MHLDKNNSAYRRCCFYAMVSSDKSEGEKMKLEYQRAYLAKRLMLKIIHHFDNGGHFAYGRFKRLLKNEAPGCAKIILHFWQTCQ